MPKNTTLLVWHRPPATRYLCSVNQQTKINKIMKKPVNKLALSTDKIVSLTKTQLHHAQGGGPSNGGVSHTCLASSITYERSRVCA